jgi:hypothetical protein
MMGGGPFSVIGPQPSINVIRKFEIHWVVWEIAFPIIFQLETYKKSCLKWSFG